VRLPRQGLRAADGAPPEAREPPGGARGPPAPAAPADAARGDRGHELSARGGGRRGAALPRGRGTAGRGGEARLRPLPVRAVGSLRSRVARLPRVPRGAPAAPHDRGRVPPSLVVPRARGRD